MSSSSDNTMTLSLFQSTPSQPSPFNGLGLFVPAAEDPREMHDIYGQLWEVLRPLWGFADIDSDSGSEGEIKKGETKDVSLGTRRKSSLSSLKKFWSF